MPTFKRTGTLSGTDTVDTIEFTVDVPATISLPLQRKVRATASCAADHKKGSCWFG